MWKILLVFYCLVHSSFLDSVNDSVVEIDQEDGGKKCDCRCGERNEASRITGGVETAVNEFPWIARLSYMDKFYCGAMLINDRFVLTAAHCVKGLMWFMIKVSLGEHDRCVHSEPPENRYVVQVIMQDFSFQTFSNDIALLKLNEKITITDRIKPVCLPHDDGTTYAGNIAIAAGWGLLGENKNQSCTLQEVELPVLSNDECKNAGYSTGMVTDDMVCAGFPEVGGKDSCKGDSGGPLITERSDKRYELIGVVSWGIGCGQPHFPGVYTRVTKYLYWIRHNARHGCFCKD